MIIWLRVLFRGQTLDPCRKLSFLKSVGTGRTGKLELRWLELAEGDIKKKCVRNRRRN